MKIRIFYSLMLLFALANTAIAQDSLKHTPDSLRNRTDSSTRRRYFDSTLFNDNNTLTESDYLIQLEKVYQTLDKVPVVANGFELLGDIKSDLDENDTALAVIKERLSGNERSLNLRNLQMFYSLLEAIQESDKKSSATLNSYDLKLDAMKKEVFGLRGDTILRHLFRDSAMRKKFSTQLKGLRGKWGTTDTLVRTASNQIENLKAHASANLISVTEMLNQTSTLLARVGPRAFTKERNYLWEPLPGKPRLARAGDFKRAIDNENKAVRYYFENTRSKRAWLFVIGVLFFVWVAVNFRAMKNRDKLPLLAKFHFKYIHPYPIAACLVWMLVLAPLFDLEAPAIYIESTQFLLMVVLIALFWKRWSRTLFYYWCAIVILFVLLSATRILGLPFSLQRWWVLFINGGGVFIGWLFRQRLKKSGEHKAARIGSLIYIVLNFLAVICNIFGRSTLTQIFGYTSIYTFAQIIALRVFVRLLEEAFLLQIQASRVKKNYPEYFDTTTVLKGYRRLVTILAVFICCITIAINLNIYNFIYRQLNGFLTSPQNIGSISFTFGGILLFLVIIWLANFLQKYIAYFFGDIGDDAVFDNKGARSRLMITRLVLLIAGFLLAVAASGLPMDKITVVLGALGVGIGLGLQGIVNNFVSGVILIFDRPLRIGDTVEVGDKKGRVKEISIRSSTLLTSDGAEVIIPNGDVLSHNIVNWTLSNAHVRTQMSLTVDGDPDIEKIKQRFTEILAGNKNVLQQRQPELLFTYLKGKAVQIQLLFWCRNVELVDVTKSEISKEIYSYLHEQQINVV